MFCFVPFCKSKRRSSSCRAAGISFHEFPGNFKMMMKWIDAISEKTKVSIQHLVPDSRSVVCSLHFSPEDFKFGLKKKFLKPGCIPCIFESPHSSYSPLAEAVKDVVRCQSNDTNTTKFQKSKTPNRKGNRYRVLRNKSVVNISPKDTKFVTKYRPILPAPPISQPEETPPSEGKKQEYKSVFLKKRVTEVNQEVITYENTNEENFKVPENQPFVFVPCSNLQNVESGSTKRKFLLRWVPSTSNQTGTSQSEKENWEVKKRKTDDVAVPCPSSDDSLTNEVNQEDQTGDEAVPCQSSDDSRTNEINQEDQTANSCQNTPKDNFEVPKNKPVLYTVCITSKDYSKCVTKRDIVLPQIVSSVFKPAENSFSPVEGKDKAVPCQSSDTAAEKGRIHKSHESATGEKHENLKNQPIVHTFHSPTKDIRCTPTSSTSDTDLSMQRARGTIRILTDKIKFLKCKKSTAERNVRRLKHSLALRETEIIKLKKELIKYKTAYHKYHIDLLKSGIESKDPLAYFMQDQLVALKKKKMDWSDYTIENIYLLYHKSPAAFQLLKSLNILHLPAENTLKRYVGIVDSTSTDTASTSVLI